MESLKKKRKNYKKSANQFVKYVEEIDLNNINIPELKVRLEIMEQSWDKFDDVQTQIEDFDPAKEDNEREAFEELYFTIVGKARGIIQENDAAVSEVIDTTTPTSPQLERQNHPSCKIQLPILTLPSFNGEYDKWLLFKDSFVSTIHENTSLSNVEKFRYLRSILTGDALQVISSLETTNDNYSIAWQLIKNRYENQRIIIHTHMKAIFDMPAINKETYVSLRQIIDTFQMHVRALQALKEPVEHWSTILIHLLSTKLDNKIRRDWETEIGDRAKPTLDEYFNFLSHRCQILEISDKVNKLEAPKPNLPRRSNFLTSTSTPASAMTKMCNMCNKPRHAIYGCYKFLALTVAQRIAQASRLKLCLNCLRSGHKANECRGKLCHFCNKRHNSLLHDQEFNQNNPKAGTTQSSTVTLEQITATAVGEEQQEAVVDNINCTTICSSHRTQVILPTAIIKVYNHHKNKYYKIRALLDTGSQSNFITKTLCNKLNLKTSNLNINISGLNHSLSKTTFKCSVNITSVDNNYNKSISCLVIDNITNQLPSPSLNIDDIMIPEGISLADETFYESQPIDMLLGVSTFFEILCKEKISLGKGKPNLQRTLLGWIVAGTLSIPQSSQITTLLCVEQEVCKQLEKFWELEEPPTTVKLSKEEQECLDNFSNTTTRDKHGHFIVQMPLKDTLSQLGNTKDVALKRLFAIEKKLDSNPNLKENYVQFMREYAALDHMTEIHQNLHENSYYLPHHPVLKVDSSTTKVRVVFDGTAKPLNGLSLNQVQKVGPTIQNDLFSIVLRFRTHAVAVTADVEKMYRQVWIDQSQRHLQQICWREDKHQPIKEFQLNTVTYGQAAAPFMAIRCLFQLALENEAKHPTTSDIIKNDFYVDDLLSGAMNEEEAFQLYTDITAILAQAKFKLRKWSSNSSELLRMISNTKDAGEDIVYVCENTAMKTLGVHWKPQEDLFQYTVNLNRSSHVITKRIALSIISQIYDPLGLISPIIIIAKSFLQRLWQQHLNWDEPLDEKLRAEWNNFIFSINQVNEIKIPRMVLCKTFKCAELHGFSDASEKAYAACIYVKTTNEYANTTIRLVCAKTKVAPLKTISIPRLELCGALLLARLASKVKVALKIPISNTIYWTDSTVVLGWIHTSPHLLKSFVSNRVSEIQNYTSGYEWRHVPTQFNPADIASRGAYANQLINSKLWWQGPDWLAEDDSRWPKLGNKLTNLPELKQDQNCHTTETTECIFNKYSNFNNLIRVYSYVLRFRKNTRLPKQERQLGPLTMGEINEAIKMLVKLSQIESFKEVIDTLNETKTLNKKYKLFNLNPYMDKDAILRVGGRLENSQFSLNKKHPMIISATHPFTKLLFRQCHLKLLHAGPQLLLSHIRENYWPVGGRNLSRQTVRNCVQCFRVNPKPLETIMGNLPAKRFEAKYPFYITGVDYAGPFLLKDRKGRSPKVVKCYISLFVCLVTKAIHLELVSELTTEAFIMALRRFIARRGKPGHIYSDNGTNFVGANNKLKEFGDFIQTYKSDIVKACTSEEIDWHFIPAHSPHFGGLWEAGVKSTKHHLRRVLGNASLNFEEFNTVIIQIESILNSRPISPLSNDVNDYSPLTPGHFLVGRPLTMIPDTNLQNIPENRLANYQRLQQLNQHFWRRWATEYVSELQQRAKWKSNQQNVKIGTIVLIKDDKLPPLQWLLGRVDQLHPGADGVVRVVTLKTSKGFLFKRAINKICPLPSASEKCNSEAMAILVSKCSS